MKRMTGITGMALSLFIVLMSVNISEAKSTRNSKTAIRAERASVYDDIIAKAGQSEIVIENTLSVPLHILLGNRIVGTVSARDIERIVVPDGNYSLSVQSTERGAGMSRIVQINTNSQRFFFKAASPNPKSVSLVNEYIYEITQDRKLGRGVAPAAVAPRKGRSVASKNQRTGKSIDAPVIKTVVDTPVEDAAGAAAEVEVSGVAEDAAENVVSDVPDAVAEDAAGEDVAAEDAAEEDIAEDAVEAVPAKEEVKAPAAAPAPVKEEVKAPAAAPAPAKEEVKAPAAVPAPAKEEVKAPAAVPAPAKEEVKAPAAAPAPAKEEVKAPAAAPAPAKKEAKAPAAAPAKEEAKAPAAAPAKEEAKAPAAAPAKAAEKAPAKAEEKAAPAKAAEKAASAKAAEKAPAKAAEKAPAKAAE